MEQSAIDFLLCANRKFLEIWQEAKEHHTKEEESFKKASGELLKKLGRVIGDNKWTMSWSGKKSSTMFNETLKQGEKVEFEKLKTSLESNENFLIFPFTFWSVFFAYKDPENQRDTIFPALVNEFYGKNDNSIADDLKNIAASSVLEYWLNHIPQLSKYATQCWALFEALMDLKDNNFKDVNDNILFIRKNNFRENGKNVNNGIGIDSVKNILPFIRPDLKFYFDNKGNVTNIIRSKEMEIKNTIELLKSSKQIILTGAPGTGKTYLAKEVAKKMTDGKDENIAFCQFHPSFDYTDFVEGLRPFDNGSGNIGFKLTDGIFKDFCKKALKNYLDSRKTQQEISAECFAQDKINAFLNYAIDSDLVLKTVTGNEFYIREFNENKITVDIPGNDKATELELPYAELQKIIAENRKLEKARDIRQVFNRVHHRHQDYYIFIIYQKILEQQNNQTAVPEKEKVSLQNFVFIIDEINRGDISKIFGELFFAIDPGYRGEKGRVKTQYHNLVKNTDDLYKDGFYVPENVYIIGTMNDIDRSVESMDFAIRRRFTWKEIKAEDRISMLDDIKLSEDLKNDAKARMKALNTEISKTDSLSEAFHVGPAYFRKLEEYKGDFSKLWDLHIMPLLKEYLRGTVDPENDLKRFKDAYDLKKQTDNESASTASEE